MKPEALSWGGVLEEGAVSPYPPNSGHGVALLAPPVRSWAKP